MKSNINDVTVIVPIYNGEKYIERCIESIINQSYKNVKIICIDDNSNDNSKNIINNYAKFNDIKYIKNNEHLGVALSRNKGIKIADSDYIMFLDCDDWLDLNCIEKAIHKFNCDTDIDIVIWEIKTAYDSSQISSRYNYLYNNIITGSMATSLLSHTVENEFFLSPLLGCKLFKKSLLDDNNILFPNTIYEDDMFSFLAFINSKKVGLITGSSLYYYQHSESITHHFSEKNIKDFFETFNQLYIYIPVAMREKYYKYLNKSFISMINNMQYNTKNYEMQSYYKKLIFHYFYKNVNISEYFLFVKSITI